MSNYFRHASIPFPDYRSTRENERVLERFTNLSPDYELVAIYGGNAYFTIPPEKQRKCKKCNKPESWHTYTGEKNNCPKEDDNG